MASTHKKILARVAEKVLKNAEIHLSTKVVAIESHNEEANPRIAIKTDGGTFESDEVVVTVPLGCLKRNTLLFSPALPAPIARAIQNTSYSRLEKVYIAFPTAFWESPTTPPSATPEEPRSSPNPGFPTFANFLHPTYAASNPSSWTIELNTLSSPVFGEHAQPFLLFTTYGPCATYLTSQLINLSAISPAYLAFLTKFFQPYYSLLPNYSASNPDCIPTAALATNWQNDELAGWGTYMNFQVRDDADAAMGETTKEEEEQGEVRLEDDIRALREGVPARGLWLAGEHTAPFVALGTLTGAYWSGEAVGMRVLAANGLVGKETAHDKRDGGELRASVN